MPMDQRKKLASVVSSLVSQVLLLLPHFSSFNNISATTTTSSSSSSSSYPSSNLLPLILHILNYSEIATSICVLSSRKRRRLSSSPTSSSSLSLVETSDKDIDHEHRDDDDDNEEKEEEDDDDDDDLDFSTSSRVPPPLPSLDGFKACFRMTSATFQWLCGLLEPLLECRDPVGSPLNLSAEIRLGIGLFRLATGSAYADVARRFLVSESTARFCTKQLCRVLCTNFRFWVAFPSAFELNSVSAAFEAVSGFPNCCGVIDCARFRIVRKGSGEGEMQEDSIVAQVVVDNSSRILSIVAGFRGDKGDSRVLKSSALYKDIGGGKLLNGPPVHVRGVDVPQYLVGDGGYPLLPWLMVPFVDPVPSSGEEEFNVALQKMRLPALRTLGSLRNWGLLNRPIEEEIKTAVACIGACSILHNALLMREDYTALSDEMQDYSFHDQISQYYPDNSLGENENEKAASAIRSALLAQTREVRDSN